jgi:antitoxin component YwqK of YwqJK toxin-antitoxin module
MKKSVIVAVIGLFATSGAFAQEGELVSVDSQTNKAYYTGNDIYQVEVDGSYSGSIISYYENGEPEEIGMLSQGKKAGTWTKYDQLGNKTGEVRFRNGKKDGTWKVWSSEGILRVKMEYDEGKRIGKWQFFDELGTLSKEVDYN